MKAPRKLENVSRDATAKNSAPEKKRNKKDLIKFMKKKKKKKCGHH